MTSLTNLRQTVPSLLEAGNRSNSIIHALRREGLVTESRADCGSIVDVGLEKVHR